MGSQNDTGNSSDNDLLRKNKKYLDSGKINNFSSSIPYLNAESFSYHGLLIDENKNFKNKKNGKEFEDDEIENTVALTATTVESNIPTKIEYKEGGREVLITGSFNNWKEKIKMSKNNNGFFEIEILLPKGKYQIKFIVDGLWKCSNNIKQERDARGIKNNIIEVKDNINNINNNVVNNNNYIKIKNYNQRNSEPLNWGDMKLDFGKKKMTIEEMGKNYGHYFPEEDQLNSEAPKLPENYSVLVNINDNSKQKYFGKKKFLNIRKISYNNSFKNILQPNHTYLNHLFTKTHVCEKKIRKNIKQKKINYYESIHNNSKNSLSINGTVKTRQKFSSVVYYYPIK